MIPFDDYRRHFKGDQMKVFLTGASGVIGTVIRSQLPRYNFLAFDLPNHDARHYDNVLTAIAGCDAAAIHLAWDTRIENWKTGNINPDNGLMTFNVCACSSGFWTEEIDYGEFRARPRLR